MSSAWDTVIRGAAIYDGSGASPFIGDVALRQARIAAVGEVRERGGVEIDARGWALAPGFIDVHTHDDTAVFLAPAMDFKLMQG
ncbi:MAG: D-aminoacylase, partial [Candidatus Binataceae bacterium]